MFTIEAKTLYFTDALTRDSLPACDKQLRRLKRSERKNLERFDLSRLEDLDSAGAVWLFKTGQEYEIRIENASERVQGVLDIFTREGGQAVPPEPSRETIFVRAGEHAIRSFSMAFEMLVLSSDIFAASLRGLFNTRNRKKGSVVSQALILGVDAFGIIALLSFIIGLILAMQGAAQLRQFGANIFVADLIAVSMVREMGPMMTAIIVAGRSGSAIASEVATMNVSEELDALKMMALDPVDYVVVPKFLAITYTMPMLVMISIVVGMLGGLAIGVTYLDLGPGAYISESFYYLTLQDLMIGLGKSVFFAWVIVIIGSFYGFKATGGSEGVGKSTTSSVVVSIFAVIVLDALFSLLFLV